MQSITRNLKLLTLTAIISIMQLGARAQEKTTDVNINVNKGGSAWYSHPVVWIIGGLVFILLLVALLRGNNRD